MPFSDVDAPSQQSRWTGMPAELLIMIFNESTSKELLNCALTCRGWKEAALDVKWRDNVVPFDRLMAVFAPLVTVEGQVDDEGNTRKYKEFESTLYSPASSDDRVRRLLEAGAKVTSLEINITLGPASSSWMEKIFEGRPNAVLCPNLNALQIVMGRITTSTYHIPPTSWLISSQQVVSWNVKPMWDKGTETLEMLALTRPPVRDLTIDVIGPIDVSYSTFQELQSLVHDAWFIHSIWESLSACPTLRRVRLERRGFWVGDRDWDDYDALHFQSLQDLDIGAVTKPQIAVPILLRSVMPELRKLETSMKLVEGNFIDMILDRLAERCLKLEHLRMDFSYEFDVGQLCLFGNLRHFELIQANVDHWPAISDDHVAMLAFSMPRLETFIFVEDDSYRAGKGVSWWALFSLATHCEALKEVALPVDATAASASTLIDEPHPKFLNLRALRFSALYITESLLPASAAFIAGMCPNVTSLEAVTWYPHWWPDYSNHWESATDWRDAFEEAFFSHQALSRSSG